MYAKHSRRFIFVALKTILFGISAGYIIYRLFGSNNIHLLSNLTDAVSGAAPQYSVVASEMVVSSGIMSEVTFVATLLFFLVIFGMLLNWSFETIKWRFLYNKVCQMSLKNAWKGVLSGTAVSMWMPNRMGDYFGRILYLPGHHYGKAIVCSILGSMSQFLATLMFGLTGLIWWLFASTKGVSIQSTASGNLTNYSDFFSGTLPFFVVLPVLTGFFALYLFLPYYAFLFPEKVFKFRLKRYIRVLYRFTFLERIYVLILSILRYLVFSLQFVLLLYVFGAGIAFWPAIFMIWVVFLVQSLIPSFALTEVGVRGAASLFFLGFLTTNDPALIMATYTLWAVNIVIPASLGALFILKAENPLLKKSSAIFRNPVNFRYATDKVSQSSSGLQTVTAIGHTSRQHAEN